MPVLTDIRLLATPVRGARQGTLHLMADAALAWHGHEITWVGPRQLLPPSHDDGVKASAEGGLVLPGLVDCHTHLAFAGWRADEFEQRLCGRSYEAIARSGGGIQRTVDLTRRTRDEDLRAHCLRYLAVMAALGVTTVECKSGYGLTVEHELRLLEVYRRVSGLQPVRIVPTLLGAHVVPPEFRDDRQRYVSLVADVMVAEAARAGLARFCDVFVEASAFSCDEAREILAAARRVGLGLKVHADQLRDGGGAALAASAGATSADHVDEISPAGITALAVAGTVAVSLPIATLYLGRPPLPARALLDAGVPVAVATDFNPGTAPSCHLPLAMMLGCTLQRMTPSEVLWGATSVAAAALGLDRSIGALEVGFRPDFIVVDAPDVEHWLYEFSIPACRQTWIDGRRIGPN